MTDQERAIIACCTAVFILIAIGAVVGSAVIKECVVNHPSVWAEKTKFYVELEKGLYLTSGQGDPSRTLSLENACLFCTVDEAEKSISKARKYRPFKNAKVIANKPIYNWVLESPTLYEEPIPAKGSLSYWEYEEFKEVKIECPECGMIQPALIDRSGPWDSFVRVCRNCSYMITESDWEEVE